MAYRHGEFTWLENITPDVDASSEFFSAVFDWRCEATPMPDGGTYTVINVNQKTIGGILTVPSRPGVEPPPPHWTSYISVPDVDDTLAKIHAAGGAALMAPSDIPQVGRLALVRDPQGATLHVWKGATEDPERRDEPGDLHWTELWSTDADASVAFYTETFGLSVETTPMPEGPYHVLSAEGAAPLGGIMQSPAEGAPSTWVSYIHVEDVDATIAKVEEHGGKVVVPAMDVEQVGRFCVFADPLGAALGVITPAKKD